MRVLWKCCALGRSYRCGQAPGWTGKMGAGAHTIYTAVNKTHT